MIVCRDWYSRDKFTRRRNKWMPWPEVNDSRLLTPLRVRRSAMSHQEEDWHIIFFTSVNRQYARYFRNTSFFFFFFFFFFSPPLFDRQRPIKHLEYDLFFSKINVTTRYIHLLFSLDRVACETAKPINKCIYVPSSPYPGIIK